MGHYRSKDSGQHCGDSHNDDVLGVLNPAERVMPQQDIAYRSASQRGGGSNNDDPKRIHTTASGSECTGHGFGSDPDEIKDM